MLASDQALGETLERLGAGIPGADLLVTSTVGLAGAPIAFGLGAIQTAVAPARKTKAVIRNTWSVASITDWLCTRLSI